MYVYVFSESELYGVRIRKCRIVRTADDYAVDEQFLNQFVYNNPTIKDNIIREYLSGLTNTTPVKVVSNLSSSIPVSPPNIPSTIEEAGKLAKNIIKQI